eukprot:COSAG02_NODE_907_length_16005_cov_3.219252_6_plen_423_part_00
MATILGLELKAVHVNAWVDWVFVQVQTDHGVQGLGELSVRARASTLPLTLVNYHTQLRAGRIRMFADKHAWLCPATQAGGLATGASCLKALDCLAIIEAELRGRNACNVVELTGPLLARGAAPPPVAGDGKDANKIWLCAVSAVEQALWDILGKVTNKPVFALLGGSWQGDGYGLRLYANINRITRLAEERVPSTFARNAAAAIAAGHSAVKLGPFDHGQKATSGTAELSSADTGAGGVADWDEYIGGQINDISAPDAQLGIQCIEAVREAVGPEVAVLVDVHSRFTIRGATQLLERLQPLKLHWLEDTVRGLDTPGGVTEEEVQSFVEWATVCGDDPQVICAGGEQHPSAQHAWKALSLPRTYQTMLADVLFLGGIAELKRIADFAALRDVAISPHCPWVGSFAHTFATAARADSLPIHAC